MVKIKIFLSSVWALLVPMFIYSQLLNQMPLEEDYVVRVYPPDLDYDELRTNRLADTPFLRMSREDIRFLKDCISHAQPPKYPQYKPAPDLRNGVFIEVAGIYGIYLKKNQYVEIVNHFLPFGESGYFPKPFRSRIDSLIESYRNLSTSKPFYMRYDSLPVNDIAVREVTHSGFSRGKWFEIVFNVQTDSLQDVPMTYFATCLKKKGFSFVNRRIQPWKSPFTPWDDSQSRQLLVELFPQWASMTNQERMRLLDDVATHAK